MYFVVYHGAGHSIADNLHRFKTKWPGVSYDVTVQRDGFQRLDEKRVSLPWMRHLRQLFEDPKTKLVTKARIDAFMNS